MNGSTVDAFAEGEVSAAFSTRNDRPNEKGGHIYISDSVVKAIARYVENGDGPIPYSENQDGETSPEPQGENIGIIAQTSEGVTPAVISIIRSKVTLTARQSAPSRLRTPPSRRPKAARSLTIASSVTASTRQAKPSARATL